MQKQKRQCVFAFICNHIVFYIHFSDKTPLKIRFMRFCKFASMSMRFCIQIKNFLLFRKKSTKSRNIFYDFL